MFDEYKGHDIAVYGAYLSDIEELRESASGALGTALAEQMIDNGGYVAGVVYSEDFYRAEYILINKKEDLFRLKGSKYVVSQKNGVFEKIKDLLKNNRKVLFIGLPCEVAALYQIVGSRHANLLTCELICSGPTKQKVHEEYIKFLENKFQSKILEFSVTFKSDQWSKNRKLNAKFRNGKIFQKPFFETEYGVAFSILSLKSCYNCRFKGNNRQGDLMIGDFWGTTPDDVFWNNWGVSAVLAETHKGNKFLLENPYIDLFETDFEKVVTNNLRIICSRKWGNCGIKFEEDFLKHGLLYAANQLNDNSIPIPSELVSWVNRNS